MLMTLVANINRNSVVTAKKSASRRAHGSLVVMATGTCSSSAVRVVTQLLTVDLMRSAAVLILSVYRLLARLSGSLGSSFRP